MLLTSLRKNFPFLHDGIPQLTRLVFKMGIQYLPPASAGIARRESTSGGKGAAYEFAEKLPLLDPGILHSHVSPSQWGLSKLSPYLHPACKKWLCPASRCSSRRTTPGLRLRKPRRD